MNDNNDFSRDPSTFDYVTNNYNMVDENYLGLPLLLDYFKIGGTNLF